MNVSALKLANGADYLAPSTWLLTGLRSEAGDHEEVCGVHATAA